MNQPAPNTLLEEVVPENLVQNHTYMIQSNLGDGHQGVKYRGKFVESERYITNVLGSYFMITESDPRSHPRNGNITCFYDHSTRYYTSSEQKRADQHALRTYINHETARFIDQETGKQVGDSIVYQCNHREIKRAWM